MNAPTLRPPTVDPMFSSDIEDVHTPGVIVQVTQDEADRLGAFQEDALDFQAALDSNQDGEVA